jgi:sulfane dehydrogenase subunit SoxC
MLAGTAGLVGSRVLAAQQGREDEIPADPTKVRGGQASEVGRRSRVEHPKRTFFSSTRTASNTPLQELEGIVTPADLHFERHHGGVPQFHRFGVSRLPWLRR